MCIFVCCLIVVPLPPGKNPFVVQFNNNNNNNNSNWKNSTYHCYREGLSYCIDNIQSVNPYQKGEVLLSQAKITSWAVASLREHVLMAEQPRKTHKLKGKGSLNQGTYSWLRKLPWAR
jgi:hypothetical protein